MNTDKEFMSEDFLLHTPVARTLYHDYAKPMPIFDYHCHLPVDEIATNRKFDNLTQIWLDGDHYKWRAMRAFGVEEKLITGTASDELKFQAWAKTVPGAIRNPLYHWTHMELRNPFGITDLLNGHSAERIYATCNEMLQDDEFSTRGLLRKMKVKVVCTTDDPVDNLEHHIQMSKEDFGTRIYPAFRPDQGMAVGQPESFNQWVEKLEAASGISVDDFDTYLAALRQRHDFFHKNGCRLSDHGISELFADDYTDQEIKTIFDTVRSGKALSNEQVRKFQSCMLHEFAVMDHERDWTQQYHIGALRSVNTRMVGKLGRDTGFDSIGDWNVAAPLGHFLNRLDSKGELTRTILYNLNPKDNPIFASMIGNFQDGSIRGKMQFGSGWWFLDQKAGMIDQINNLSNMGLLSCFVGMLTDSRSFLSYPRHEYFRRILCMLLGEDVANGEIPDEIELLGDMVRNICYNNAVNYFQMETPD